MTEGLYKKGLFEVRAGEEYNGIQVAAGPHCLYIVAENAGEALSKAMKIMALPIDKFRITVYRMGDFIGGDSDTAIETIEGEGV